MIPIGSFMLPIPYEAFATRIAIADPGLQNKNNSISSFVYLYVYMHIINANFIHSMICITSAWT